MHLPSPATRNKDMTPASSPQQNGTIRRRAKRNCRLIANPIQIANKNSASAPSAIGYIPDSFAKRSEEHTSELQSLMRISYAVFCLKKKKTTQTPSPTTIHQHQYT